MVTLPQLNDYSKKDLDHFSTLSPIYSQYRGVLKKEPTDFLDQLRKEKHKYWLECAFATLADNHTPEQVCLYWSHHAENIIRKAWNQYLIDHDDISLFAFGKLGSQELNLSSDIDIVFVKNSDQRQSTESLAQVKKFIQSLSEVRSTGFAFRVDTNLRPGGDSSPLLPNQDNFYNFYDSYLEAWHRISFVRLRPIAGKKDFNDQIMNYCQRLSFPRRLDYSIIQDIKGIRSRLQTQWRKANEPLDVKFYPGGIRDVELYIQSLQVIYGGHKNILKTSSISKALHNLHQENVISESHFKFISQFYWKLRKVENHIHCLKDQHTYRLTKDVIDSFAHPFNETQFLEELNESNQIVSEFFVDTNTNQVDSINETKKFSKTSIKAINEIKELSTYSLKKSAVEKQKTELLNKYISLVDNIAVDQDLAIQIFRDFIFSIKSKSSIFYLLNRHEKLLENIAWLFSFSPYIGNLLCQRPELVDSFALGNVDLNTESDLDELLESLIDYKLLGQIISVSYLLKKHNVREFYTNISQHADLIASTLLNHLQKQFNSKKIDILCLGKWSGHELGIQSDLDFIFLCDEAPSSNEVKVARRFINLMTTPSKAGKLYSIDLRLKPNDSSGPLMLQKSKLIDFLKTKAQPWQKQAYLKSRLLSDNSYFYKSVSHSINVSNEDIQELEKVHQQLITNNTDRIDLKYDSGGLVETEFTIQLHVLKKGLSPQSSSLIDLLSALNLSKDIESQIIDHYFFIRRFEQIYQVCMESSSTKVPINHPALDRLAKVLKLDDPYAELKSVMTLQNSLLKSLDAST